MLSESFRTPLIKNRFKRDVEGLQDDSQYPIFANVEIVIFTEHLLLKEYCDKYSKDDLKCKTGIAELNKFVQITATGVSTYYITKTAARTNKYIFICTANL